MKLDRARIRVDFNEMVSADVVLLANFDLIADSEGNEVSLSEGLAVFIYDPDLNDDGQVDALVADGVAEMNDPKGNGRWTKAARWCCRIDERGIEHLSKRNT